MSQETKIASYLASELQKEQVELRKRDHEERTEFLYSKMGKLYSALTRLAGLAEERDGSVSGARRRSDPSRSVSTQDEADRTTPTPRVLIDVTPTYRNGHKNGVQRIVREIARNAMETGRVLPVFIDNGQLMSSCRGLAIPQSIEIAEGDRFLMLDASLNLVDEYLPIMRKVSQSNGENIAGVHDLVPLLYPTAVDPEFRSAYRRWFDEIVLACDAIVCASEATSDSFLDYVSQNHCVLKPNFRIGQWKLGGDFELDVDAPLSTLAIEISSSEAPYFLSVGALEPHKAYPVTLSAFEKLWSKGIDVRYVVAGRPGCQSRALERRICEHPEYGRRLFWLDDANDADLDCLYRHAHALTVASFAEGSGLPLVEAARYNLPIIASDIPIFREIGGDSIRYFDVLDSDNLARCILDALVEGHVVSASAANSWRDSTRGLLNLIRNGDYQHHFNAELSAERNRPEPQAQADGQSGASALVYDERLQSIASYAQCIFSALGAGIASAKM
jgi:glycosyltransferase involved in cell wall biosynthesis